MYPVNPTPANQFINYNRIWLELATDKHDRDNTDNQEECILINHLLVFNFFRQRENKVGRQQQQNHCDLCYIIAYHTTHHTTTPTNSERSGLNETLSHTRAIQSLTG